MLRGASWDALNNVVLALLKGNHLNSGKTAVLRRIHLFTRGGHQYARQRDIEA